MSTEQIMPPNVKVCINGFVLSTLLFDCANNTSDQEGFLYGSVTRNVRREISDHSMTNTQEDILISICSSVPSGSFLSFYNNVGEIKREDLEYNLSERAGVQNIVGWYRFRRYSAMFPSIREQSTYRHLRDFLTNGNRLVDTSYFVLGVLSSSNLPNFATHSYDYGFFIQRRDGSFKDLPLTILNLGDTRNSYRAGSMALPFMNSSSFNSVLSSSWNFDTFFDTENQIHEFHQRLRAKLDSLQEELAASDAVNASLEDDIKRISNEMQALLATQEYLVYAASAAAKESELAEANVNVENLESADMNNEEKINEFEVAQDEVIKTSENKKKESEGNDKWVSMAAIEALAEMKEVKVLDVNENNSKAKEIVGASKKEIAACKDIETVGIQKCESVNPKDNNGDVKESEPMDLNDGSGSPCSNKKSSSSLKRTSEYPLEDDRSSKRFSPFKYFQNEEYISDKSVAESATEAASTAKLEDTKLSISHEKVSDMDIGELPSQQSEHIDLPSEISTSLMKEPKIPSPASNVEVTSDAELQINESELPVDETVSSSDELADIKESDAKEPPSLVSDSKSNEPEASKSLSDSDICCETEALTTNRCGSAPAGFLSQVAGSSENKSSSSNRTASKVRPPFIIYAAKKTEDTLTVSNGNHSHESKPTESVTSEVADENSKLSSQVQKDEQKCDVQGSIEKVD